MSLRGPGRVIGFADPEGSLRARDTLVGAGYSEEGLRDALGLADLLDMRPIDHPAALRRTRSGAASAHAGSPVLPRHPGRGEGGARGRRSHVPRGLAGRGPAGAPRWRGDAPREGVAVPVAPGGVRHARADPDRRPRRLRPRRQQELGAARAHHGPAAGPADPRPGRGVRHPGVPGQPAQRPGHGHRQEPPRRRLRPLQRRLNGIAQRASARPATCSSRSPGTASTCSSATRRT